MSRWAADKWTPARFNSSRWGGTVEIITAVLTPTMSRLYEGQSVQDVTNWSSFTNASNYASTEGTIGTPFPSFSGDALAADTVLSEGDTAGFSIAVTDDQGNGKVFVASQITVEYIYELTETASSKLDIDINDIVPDAYALGDIIISGSGSYNGTYTGITAGDIRDTPYCFGNSNSAGSPTISGTAEVGQTLTVDPGLWSVELNATLTFTYQWQRDGVNISGETGTTYDIVEADAGTDITCEVTGSDGTNTNMFETAATSIPGGTFSVTQVGSVLNTQTVSGSTPVSSSFDFGAAASGKKALVFAGFGLSSTGTPATCTVGGSSATQVIYKRQNNINHVGAWVADVSAGGSLTVAITPPASNDWRNGVDVAVYVIENSSTSETGVQDGNGAYGAISLNTDVLDGDVLLCMARMDAVNTTGNFTAVSLIEETGSPYDSDGTATSTDTRIYRHDATADEVARTVSLTPTGDGSGVVVACLVRITP